MTTQPPICPKTLGYIRTSTHKQLTDRQVNRLEDICDEVFIESGVSARAKRLTLAILHERGVIYKSLTNDFDTTTPEGLLLFTIQAALSEWEVGILSRRTKEGMIAAKKRGKILGRPRKTALEKINHAERILEAEFYSALTELAQHFCTFDTTITDVLER